ncbi:MAG: ASPIC/UnbV domain-containing protein [Planctomycetales bacterium]|nr:ASPIC/UnbV domain-containing protein [Planctomycetales bacterium]
MSQSPTSDADIASGGANNYLSNWNALGAMIRDGASFSGRERNRCFLNIGGETFADVSAITGLDQIEDGRAIGLVDWDHDGDVDVWLANRNGPRVRMLQNDSPESVRKRSVVLTLTGFTCNRDAIGARVELVLNRNDSTTHKRVKTLRAGEGFLSQSSKAMHFGLGEYDTIQHARVYWPGEQQQPEQFDGITVGGRFQLTQGKGTATQIDLHRNVALEAVSDIEPKAASDPGSRTVLTRRMKMPDLAIRNLSDQELLPLPAGQPLLINLWASWCQPCMEELAEFKAQADSIKASGLQVVALSVDSLGKTDETSDSTSNVVASIEFPFENGQVDADTVRKLTTLMHTIFYPTSPLPLPCSFLVDAKGNVAVVYRGRVSVKQLLSDVALLDADPNTILAAAFPFSGRRLLRTQEATSLRIARAYFEGDYLALARKHALRHLEEVSAKGNIDRMAEYLADSLKNENREAIKSALLAEQTRQQLIGLQLLAAIDRSRGNDLDLIQTLLQLEQLVPEDDQLRAELIALALKTRQRDMATRVMADLKSRATTHPAAKIALGQTLMRQQRLQPAIQQFTEAVKLAPNNIEARFNLAAASQVAGMNSEAIAQYREILKLAPDHVESLNNLAWLYANDSDKQSADDAVSLARRLCELSGRHSPSHLDTLAVALAAAGNFEDAMATLNEAMDVASAHKDSATVEKLRSRLQQIRDQVGK